MSAIFQSSAAAPAPRKARIEIIPLIDVIFFLLATFVLFTLSLNKSGGLPVTLPAAASGESRDPSHAVTLTIRDDGSLGWDKRPLTLDQFLAELQALRQTTPDARILINGDENALCSQVRYVVDEARKAGFTRVHFETRIRSATEAAP
ncbi:biopolymer transport protein [Opitutaceae bacterium TAV1]|nr:biopolymer transportern ExbD [Opitutaceae bacterium TAV5]EIQ00934.1 biopolymer transport protein [Opitutaceae bacterium TAV1]